MSLESDSCWGRGSNQERHVQNSQFYPPLWGSLASIHGGCKSGRRSCQRILSILRWRHRPSSVSKSTKICWCPTSLSAISWLLSSPRHFLSVFLEQSMPCLLGTAICSWCHSTLSCLLCLPALTTPFCSSVDYVLCGLNSCPGVPLPPAWPYTTDSLWAVFLCLFP